MSNGILQCKGKTVSRLTGVNTEFIGIVEKCF